MLSKLLSEQLRTHACFRDMRCRTPSCVWTWLDVISPTTWWRSSPRGDTRSPPLPRERLLGTLRSVASDFSQLVISRQTCTAPGETMLRRARLRTGNGHCCIVFVPREELWASWWPGWLSDSLIDLSFYWKGQFSGYHHWKRAIPLSRGFVPTVVPWYGVHRNPRDHLQFHHEVRRRHSKGGRFSVNLFL